MSVSPAFSKGLPSSRTGKSWSLEQMAGRLVDISGQKAAANLTVAFGLVLEAQKRGEPVAWVTLQQSTFYPPDVADSGISRAHPLGRFRARRPGFGTGSDPRCAHAQTALSEPALDTPSHQARRAGAQAWDRGRYAHRKNRAHELGELSHLVTRRGQAKSGRAR